MARLQSKWLKIKKPNQWEQGIPVSKAKELKQGHLNNLIGGLQVKTWQLEIASPVPYPISQAASLFFKQTDILQI